MVVNGVGVVDGDLVPKKKTGDPVIAKRIEKARREIPLTDEQIGARLGRSGRWVYEVAHAMHGVKPRDLVPLAQALNVRVGLLLGEDDPSEPSELCQRVAAFEEYLDRRDQSALLDFVRTMASRHPNWQHRGLLALRVTESDAEYDVTAEEMPGTGGGA